MTATTARCSLSQVAVVGSATPSPSVESMIPKSISTGTTCPGKITAVFGDITISSSFDSGNLARAEECRSTDGPDTREFDLWISRDCAGTEFENGNKTWFYFSVTTPSNFSDKMLRFNIRNLNRQAKLYQQGLTPITKTIPGRGSWERLRGRVDYENTEDGLRISFQLVITDSRKLTTYFAFCYPFSYSECQRRLTKLDEHFKQSSNRGSGDEIYYHRELVCRSLEGRRIDLLTVTSWEGVSDEREPGLSTLFPDGDSERCHVFRNKKVIFVSSRVHPGESPSSFVFNGLLQFILRPSDPRAVAVRKKFVFKMIPMLNPDGVYRGHYRTDTRGANLNRHYLNPDPSLHPSIHAARTLILHYHQQGILAASSNHTRQINRSKKSTELSRNLHASSIPSFPRPNSRLLCGDVWSRDSDSPAALGSPLASPHTPVGILTSKSLPPHLYTADDTGRNLALANHSPKTLLHPLLPLPPSHKTLKTSPLADNSSRSLVSNSSETGANPEVACDHIKVTQESGVALYVDLHAHATKRGIFMFGNYFSNVAEAAENMLFPKLLSLNSQHLDFEHCVFTERNMYTMDKREGTSKEGSGRVAMHKATGIIPCYTLECNYNSGRQCNPVSEATMDDGRASPSFSYSPMSHRFSIADFEQVGRALAISVLDLYQMNPWSRLPTTQYTCLTNMRQSLIQRINIIRVKKLGIPKEEGSGVACSSSDYTGVSLTTSNTSGAGVKVCAPVAKVPAPVPVPTIPSRQSLPGITSRTGRVMDVSHLLEGKQTRRSAVFRVSSHVKGSVVTSSSRSASRRTEQSRMGPFTVQSMKVAPPSVMFPSPLTSSQSDPRRTDTSSSHVNDGRMSAVHRKSLKSSRSIPPVAKRSNGRNKAPAHFTSASVREQSTKSSVFIADSSPRQQNHIPSVKYFTRRSLLKIPVSDQAKCGSNSSDKALGNRALSSLDSALPADRVVPTSASH